MKYLLKSRVLLSKLCLLALLLPPGATLAGAPATNTGQLSFARQVSINGSDAIAGQTVFNGNWFKVASRGTAIVNAGKLGRFELGAESDFISLFSESSIGGKLNAGCLMISAPAGIGIMISTSKGTISSDGKEPVSLSVGYKGEVINVVPNLGEVEVKSGNKTENVKAGEWIALTAGAGGESNLLRRSAKECGGPGALCACNTSSVPNTSAPAPKPGVTAARNTFYPLLPLLAVAVAGSAAILFSASDGAVVAGQSLTCIDSAGIFCREVSISTP